jgi:hypothetical protein
MGVGGEDQERFRGLRVDRVHLPFDVYARIQSQKAPDLGTQVRAISSQLVKQEA